MVSRQKGFTLIELVIVVAIIGILTSIAWGQYQGYVLRAGRTEGMAMLTDVASREERYYTQTHSYITDVGELAKLGVNSIYSAVDPDRAKYELTISLGDTADSYVLSAKAHTDFQKKDLRCDPLTLDSTGLKGPQDCW